MSPNDQVTYYSNWQYAAIHIALTIPELQSAPALTDYFRIPQQTVHRVLEFLINAGLAIQYNDQSYQIGQSQIRLGNNSPNIFRHHSNWRLMALDSLDRETFLDFHYSSVVSLSKKDIQIIKDQILKNLKEYLETITDSKEEELYSLCIDFFNVKRI